jgi:ABC-2 type transport system ATP-binding protein
MGVMPGIVEVEDLVKEFRSFERREGLLGAVGDLFSRRYRALRAVDRVSFDIRPGEMVGYIGPNGAGKSTTIKMLSGILVPSAGDVMANGFVPWRERSRYARTIGAVFGQRTQLWWDIAVVESFRLLRRIYEVPEADYRARMSRFDELLELGRYLHTPVRKLSLGERMRCDVAAALLHNPPLLFLDEPTIGLDIVAKENIRTFLRQANRDFGTTMLLTTHDLSDIEELCERLMIIDHGRLLFDGSLPDLRDQLWREHAVRFDLKDPAQAARLDALEMPGVTRERVDEMSVRLRFPRHEHSPAEIIRRVVNTVEVRDIAIEEQSIEEVVRRIYLGEELQESRR